MRKTWLVGGVLTVAAMVVVVLSDLFDLKLEAVALLGVAVGAVVALVPDRTPLMRLIGFGAGFAAAWVGYLVRAGFLPDSIAGRAVSVGMVLLVCVVVAGVTANRVPLWATLLGAVSMVGAYEYTYAAAPPEVTSTSMSAATSLLMTAAIGFLAVALLAHSAERSHGQHADDSSDDNDEHHQNHTLDEMMERAK